MNKDYLSIARQRLESQCSICSNKVMISFVLTIVLLYLIKGFRYRNVLDLVLPVVLFGAMYVIVGTVGVSMMSNKMLEKEYEDVKNTVQSYMNNLNEALFRQSKKNEGNEHNAQSLPDLPKKIKYPCPTKKDDRVVETFDSMLASELEKKYADAKMPPADIGCMLNKSVCDICSGYPKPADLVAPIPGPQWQPQNAATVQKRIAEGNFVPSNCLN